MHDTNCCAIRWSVQIAFCERRNCWRAIAHTCPSDDPTITEGLLDETLSDLRIVKPNMLTEVDELIAVSRDGETAGQAAMAACQAFEHYVAVDAFDYRSASILERERWLSRPAARRFPSAGDEPAQSGSPVGLGSDGA